MAGQPDPVLQQFIEAETQRQRFQVMVSALNDKCWDLCFDSKPSTRLESKTENCLKNCVDRFIDTTNFMVNRLEKTALSSGLAPSEFEVDN
ncbi:unnamed protein product [Notodromas monacha]|uniref:Mitochondrial import inner membrane translocase subunit n=1 Tax=Notodromas monacha TaxID=399045 RepID=A0A7R9BJD9_9CRUS|nr:unnamed protein product [Notodromas monacha]CAG0915059.1 unnamed protein product [Notodromas monacha]